MLKKTVSTRTNIIIVYLLRIMQAMPVFTFSNQAGLDMLETTLVALQDISLEKIFDDNGRKTLFSEFPQIIQQVNNFFYFIKMHDFLFFFKSSFLLNWWYAFNRPASFSSFIMLYINFASFSYDRVLHVCKVVFVSQAWDDLSHTRELLLGRC